MPETPELAGWIMLGLIAGALARWILPGEEKGGWFMTLLLGILGAVVGGWITRHFGFLPADSPGKWLPSLRALASATVGAIVLLSIWKWLKH